MDKTFSPGERRWMTAEVAALPEENATLYNEDACVGVGTYN